MRQISQLMRSGSLNGYVELVESLGRDPYAFMRSVGLEAKFLEDPEMLIPRDAARELLEITARATRIEDFALRLAARRKLSALGPISLVLREEPTPRQALDTLCRYLKLVNASLIIRVEDAGGVVIIREDLLPTPGLQMRQSVELAVGTMFCLLRELIGQQWQPLDVCFTHRPPKDVAAHRAFFRRGVKFNQEFNGLVCAAADLARPQEQGDQVAAGLARKYLEAAMTRQGESAQETCRRIILALLPGGACSAPEVARFLHIDRRTLHRRLEAEGLSFSRVLDEVRSDLVKHHLRESDLPLGEVAELLGFSRPSSFSHWFLVRFGCSASQWSKQAAESGA
ncbi:AraC family transcriptional regulator [Achromobacter insolitus]|uniref:HTH-type transcriptional regulator VirS n=1 Tax=Achromobacter insolitus TaxID=217204 RepID=A0A6S7F9T4_9BURK|nr:AraC family transcriptional regulator [Achromobacter insolitus]APX73818.1 AraC family transcriptional regulator [Achromobacter insolitus]MDQ6214774.1 AraC family transcriptional regulator [Achromobacter insolitus]OWT54675.1 AraC family transcriptional regulator [Achromobacter insolitus]CAB3733362.1 HTH-type transcriptional regulator VirS [Achromobacter insolitus]CAB3931165.1 HTH-type transcriptional regulator VirS [Achromobacter insolitus]